MGTEQKGRFGQLLLKLILSKLNDTLKSVQFQCKRYNCVPDHMLTEMNSLYFPSTTISDALPIISTLFRLLMVQGRYLMVNINT